MFTELLFTLDMNPITNPAAMMMPLPVPKPKKRPATAVAMLATMQTVRRSTLSATMLSVNRWSARRSWTLGPDIGVPKVPRGPLRNRSPALRHGGVVPTSGFAETANMS